MPNTKAAYINYSPIDWVDNSAPAINAANLNYMDGGVVQAINAVNDISLEISDIRNDIATLDLTVQNLVDLSEVYGPWVDDLRVRMTDVENRLTQVETAINTLDDRVTVVEGDITEINTELGTHDSRITTLENMISGMQQDIIDNSQGVTNNAAAIAALTCADVNAPCGTWSFNGTDLLIGM